MFLPLKDLNPTERRPYVTIALIAVNLIVFVYELTLGTELNAFIAGWGAVPYEITRWVDLVGVDMQTSVPHTQGPPLPAATLVTSMFMHGGFLHIAGNMLYLWIFGNNVEDILGSARFLLFYIICGLVAAGAHILANPGSTIPTVGASGAVAGVLGAYLIAYPRARIVTVVFLFVFIRVMLLPAGLVLAFWFLIQLFNGFSRLSTGLSGGVAWFAHIGGFVAGVVLINLLAGPRLRWIRANRGDHPDD